MSAQPEWFHLVDEQNVISRVLYSSASDAWAEIDRRRDAADLVHPLNPICLTGFPCSVVMVTRVPRPVPPRPCVGVPGGASEILWADGYYMPAVGAFAQSADVHGLLDKLPFGITDDAIRALLDLPELTRKWITQGGAA